MTLTSSILNTMADPTFQGWYDSKGFEPGSKCAYQIGQTYAATNGGRANANIGGRDYLLEKAWVNAGGGVCALTADSKYLT